MDRNAYEHISFSRAEPINVRRPGRPPRRQRPQLDDPRGHARTVLDSLTTAVAGARDQEGRRDERLLLRFALSDPLSAEELTSLPGIELVSQESGNVVLGFASEEALRTFEERLSSLSRGNEVARQNLLYALRAVTQWRPEDRMGRALREEGMPAQDTFVLDIEIWPYEDPAEIESAVRSMRQYVANNEGVILDSVIRPQIAIMRIRMNRALYDRLLKHQDVRRIDLLPRFALSRSDLRIPLEDIRAVQAPNQNAPRIVVLDTGVAQNHPLLAPAIGDAQSFCGAPRLSATDDHGHGTHVSGIALYNDVQGAVQSRQFMPQFWLLSARVLDSRAEYAAGVNAEGDYDVSLVENDVREAVEYYTREYGATVFNISFGDRRKIYDGRHLEGLSVVLDSLARQHNVLFVVSAGNLQPIDLPEDARADYPGYLLDSSVSAIIDPATALNALTVGSIARLERTFLQQQYEDDPSHLPIARRDQPSPFTRSGPSVNGAIKPDVVAYGGNWAQNVAANNNVVTRGLGELSTSRSFAEGRLLEENSGTSASSPHVAHLAGIVKGALPNAGGRLLRAVLASHAEVPIAAANVVNRDGNSIRRLVGYGKIRETTLSSSSDDIVTLFAEDAIEHNTHHFYEIPIPEEFFSQGRRSRSITIALSYFPEVRTTRIDYRAARLSFALVAGDLERVARMFNRYTAATDFQNLAEYNRNRSISNRERSRGSLQVATWTFLQEGGERGNSPFVLVVTRNDRPWGAQLCPVPEPYALSIVLKDDQNPQSALYGRIQQILRARARLRARR